MFGNQTGLLSVVICWPFILYYFCMRSLDRCLLLFITCSFHIIHYKLEHEHKDLNFLQAKLFNLLLFPNIFLGLQDKLHIIFSVGAIEGSCKQLTNFYVTRKKSFKSGLV